MLIKISIGNLRDLNERELKEKLLPNKGNEKFKVREINASYTKKQNLFRQQEQFFLTLRIKVRNTNNVHGMVSNAGVKQRNLVSMIPTDLHPDKAMLFPI